MSENYNFSDFVKFKKGSTFGIGKIENFSREEDWFEYFEYILSEELPTGWFIYCILYCIQLLHNTHFQIILIIVFFFFINFYQVSNNIMDCMKCLRQINQRKEKCLILLKESNLVNCLSIFK
ncbi:unnamed protein product [Paramecium sonneborni]|uniref:Uncharacterized protein n=1 Tax=Paramecium sonneborni TaxID=65129 RepID=A0A8S1LAE4_9CILI|nr:unnamed protein product [Paramecium sonneborni]